MALSLERLQQLDEVARRFKLQRPWPFDDPRQSSMVNASATGRPLKYFSVWADHHIPFNPVAGLGSLVVIFHYEYDFRFKLRGGVADDVFYRLLHRFDEHLCGQETEVFQLSVFYRTTQEHERQSLKPVPVHWRFAAALAWAVKEFCVKGDWCRYGR